LNAQEGRWLVTALWQHNEAHVEEDLMSALLLLAILTLGQAQPEKPVTDADKKAFLELLAKLPTKGEFFTEEAVTKAAPYTRVLLALTEKDLEKRDLYPVLALSRGLIDRKEPRQYGITHFAKIAHPTIKLFWASLLFEDKPPSWEIIKFLRQALDAKEDARTLSAMAGPGFEDFKERVRLAYEAGRQMTVELVKKHTTDAFPAYSSGFAYTNQTFLFGPDGLVHAVRPLKQQGELTTYHRGKGTTSRMVVPQPEEFKAKFDFGSYFDNPVLSINSSGDLFCRWTIEGNGDHALALLKKGEKSFRLKRSNLILANCYVVADTDNWYLIQGSPNFTVYAVDKDLQLTRLGNFSGRGFHSIRVADACFPAKDVLHLLWGDVISPGDNHLRMRCIDFDVRQQKWLHNREIFRLNTFVSSANEPTVLQLKDHSLHYIWRVDEGAKKGEATGVYYQAEADGKTVKIGSEFQYRALSVGDRIVVCYTQEEVPDKVYFRVIKDGTLGPVSEIEAAKGRSHNLWSEDMVLHADGDRIWFVNTLTRDTLYELKLAEATKP
jgi:hypothetical protein